MAVDQTNLRTQFEQVYALGDVCSRPRSVSKAGIFAELAALVVADDIAASIAEGEPPAPYGGSGVWYAEFDDGLVSKVEVERPQRPGGGRQRYDASREYAAEKEVRRGWASAGSGSDLAHRNGLTLGWPSRCLSRYGACETGGMYGTSDQGHRDGVCHRRRGH